MHDSDAPMHVYFRDAAFSATAVVETVTCAAVIAIYVLDNRAARSLTSRTDARARPSRPDR